MKQLIKIWVVPLFHLECDWRNHAYGGGLRVPSLNIHGNEEVRQEECSADAWGPEYPTHNSHNLCVGSFNDLKSLTCELKSRLGESRWNKRWWIESSPILTSDLSSWDSGTRWASPWMVDVRRKDARTATILHGTTPCTVWSDLASVSVWQVATSINNGEWLAMRNCWTEQNHLFANGVRSITP